MTTESHELALTIIHEGKYYQACCELANDQTKTVLNGFRSGQWVFLARRAATKYTKDYGTVFTARDILATALEIAEYYHEHMEREKIYEDGLTLDEVLETIED